jgi:ATP-dependent DNA ligase
MARISWYCGPDVYLKRSDLIKLEEQNKFVAEIKKDGFWVAMHVDGNGPGKHRFESRAGKPFSGSDINGLATLDLADLGGPTVLIGELEAGTEAALAEQKKVGFRRIWLHDIALCRGNDLRKVPVQQRQAILRKSIWPFLPANTQLRLPLIPQRFHKFTEFYDEVIAAGGEGLVLKRLDVAGWSHKSDGKSPYWFRIKPKRTVDYVVMGPDKTESGALNAQLGLYIKGKLTQILKYQLPRLALLSNGKLAEENLVVEMVGYEIFRSGALRSAQFVRWRPDKTPDMCVGIVSVMTEK